MKEKIKKQETKCKNTFWTKKTKEAYKKAWIALENAIFWK